MAVAPEFAPALDEIVWADPVYAQECQGIHENSILFYFQASPFFDQTSNNAVLFSQAQYNERLFSVIATRKAFEDRLRSMSGLEFMIAQEPAEMTPGTGTGVWVIRKQNRRKSLNPNEEDEITVLATYFVVGLNVYMAPSVGDILSTRLLSITVSMKQLVETIYSVTKFTPATGHTYLPPKAISRITATTAQGSREETPLPNSQANTKNLQSPTDPDPSSAEARLLSESISLSLRYGEDYMDEKPITGQPGEFLFTSTGRVEKDKLLMPVPVAKQPFASQTLKKDQPVLGIKTKDLPSRKGSKAEKSPRTAGSGKPKRKKSKVATSANTPRPTSPS